MEGFEIRTSDSRGKSLFATREFASGDVILEEDPLVSCQFAWNEAYKYLACEYCLRPLETPEENVRRLSLNRGVYLSHCKLFSKELETKTSCDQCGTMYCSEECRHNAYEKYHRILCHNPKDVHHPLFVLMESWKQMHYPPETTSIMLVVRILAYIQQSPDPSAALAKVKQFCHRTENEDSELVHKLLGKEFTHQLNVLRQLTANVISGDEVQQFLTPEGFCTLMALVGTNGQGIGTSPFAMWVEMVAKCPMSDHERKEIDRCIDLTYKHMEEESGQFLNTEGSGLYELQSSCNHSCDPNAEVTFPYGNHRLQLKAKKPINPGDEICISYLDDCSLSRSRHSRQKMLAENYLFVCSCDLCISEASQPDCTSEEEMSEEEDDMDD